MKGRARLKGTNVGTATERRRLPSRCAFAFAVVIAVAVIPAAPASFRGERGRIAFDDGRTFPSKIGSMKSDGSDVRILSERGDHWPRWSPDGSRIVFFSTRDADGSDDADAEVFVMNADGSDQIQLTFNHVRDEVPMWTPDGRIVWSQRTGFLQWDIWIMNADGSKQRRLTSFSGRELWPSPSPQGGRIAFASDYLDGRLHIFTMRSDGGDVRQLTSGELEDWAPDWSPSANDIVFTRETPAPQTSAGVDEDVFIVHADGTNLRQITNKPDRAEIFPVWAPDGKALLYPAITDWLGPNWNTLLTVYDLETGAETTVGEPNIGGAPSWQPLRRGTRPAAGALDASFGSDGVVLTDLGNSSFDRADAVNLLPHGKTIALGSSNAAGSFDFALTRYDVDGSLDASFGSGGIALTDIGHSSFDLAAALAVAPDGRIVAGGINRPSAGGFDFALARYNPDGTLDPSFGSGGKVVTDLGGSSGDSISTIALDRQGRIVAAGVRNTVVREGDTWVTTSDLALARYNPDGTLDSSFGSGGVVLTDLGSHADHVAELVIQSDGKIVAVGLTTAGGSDDFALVRYLPDGSLDMSFGSGGAVITDLGSSSDDLVFAAALQPDGKIVAAGWSDANASFDFALVRYNRDGGVDESFGSDGRALTDLAAASFDFATAVAVTPAGKIIAAGFSDSADDFALVRYGKDGLLDSSFGSGGKAFTDLGTASHDFATAVTVAPSGEIVAAGVSDAQGSLDFALARYTGR